MSSAAVTVKEVDMSTRVPSPAGLGAGIVLPANRGPVNKPTLITSEGSFVDTFGKPDPRLGLAHYSALNYLIKGDKLWVTRVANESRYAALLFAGTDSSNDWARKMDIPDDNADTADVDEANDARVADLDNFVFSDEDDSLLIVAANQGVWGQELAVDIKPSTNYGINDTSEGGYADAIVINVYKRSAIGTTSEKREFLDSYEVTLNPAFDGFGKQMFAEDKINGKSQLIKVKVNTANVDKNGKVKPIKLTPAVTGTDYDYHNLGHPMNLANGFDGYTPTIGNFMLGADLLTNKSEYNVTMLLDGGFTFPAYQIHLNTIAESRQDCIALLSVDPSCEVQSPSAITKIKQYRIDTQINSSFSGLYTPHIKMYDKYNDILVEASPDGFVAASVSEVATNREVWVPPAGWNNGKVAGLGVKRVFSKGERDVLYASGVNPLKQYPGKGISIWGQKTLQAKPSSVDRINVRLLLTYIQPSIVEFLEYFIFELNTALTRTLIVTGINTFMENIKGRGGVYDYKIICDNTNNPAGDVDNYKLNVDLYLKPTKSVEFINFRTVLTTTGADFGAVKLA